MEENKTTQERFYPARLDPNNPQKITLVPITEEQYQTLLPPIWKHQRRMNRLGMCSCTQQSIWKCDADCELCAFKTTGQMISLEDTIESSGEDIAAANSDPSLIVSKTVLTQQILSRLGELCPEAITVGKGIQSGLTQQEAIKRIGLKRGTYFSRVKKAERIICKEFKIEDLKNFF